MIEFIWHSFQIGLIEWLLLIELIVLLTAAFFYQVAKLIARQDRHDPLVRFYRVFWRAFGTPVTSMRQLDLREAEARAMAAGLLGVELVDGADLDSLDPGDFFAGDDVGEGRSNENGPPQQMTRPIGRGVPMTEDLSVQPSPATPPAKQPPKENVGRKSADTESREAKFIRQAKEAGSKPAAPAPAKANRIGGDEPERAVTSVFDALIVPFADDDKLAGFKAGEVVVHVKCAPEDGSANGVVISTVAARLGLRPYQIVLLRGHYKVRKTLKVSGLDQQALNVRLNQM